jgi:Ca2+-dependent lipid-binding protein
MDKHSFASFKTNALNRPRAATTKARPVGRRSSITAQIRRAQSPTKIRPQNDLDKYLEEKPETSPQIRHNPSLSAYPPNPNSSGSLQDLQSGMESVGINDPEMLGTLNITVVEAKGLRPDHSGGTSDPYQTCLSLLTLFSYVILKLGQEEFRSRTVRRTVNPQWNQRIKMYIYRYSPQILELVVWDDEEAFRSKG